MSKEVNIKMIVTEDIDKSFLMSVINCLNDGYFPVNEIKVDDKVVFNNTQGFRVEEN